MAFCNEERTLFEQSTIKKRLEKNLQRCDEAEAEAKRKSTKSGQEPPPHVRRFIPYNLRHTFLTRLGESGCDAWTLARIAGHSNISIGSRYVHPSRPQWKRPFLKWVGTKLGTPQKMRNDSDGVNKAESIAGKEVGWCARRDSNSRPNAPEAFALSS